MMRVNDTTKGGPGRRARGSVSKGGKGVSHGGTGFTSGKSNIAFYGQQGQHLSIRLPILLSLPHFLLLVQLDPGLLQV